MESTPTTRHETPRRTRRRRHPESASGDLRAQGTVAAGVAVDRAGRPDAPPPLLDLWRRCAAGADDEAWTELHRRLGGRIRDYLDRGLSGRYRLACPAEAEDLEQEVYCRLLAHDRRGLRSCRASTEGELLAYLLRVCRSVLSSAVRASCARKRRPVAAGGGAWLRVDPGQVPDPEMSPEDRAVAADARRKVASCAGRLLPGGGRAATAHRQRLVLRQVLYTGYTSSELAPALGLTSSAVDSIVSRARRRAHARGIPFPRRPAHDCPGSKPGRSAGSSPPRL